MARRVQDNLYYFSTNMKCIISDMMLMVCLWIYELHVKHIDVSLF